MNDISEYADIIDVRDIIERYEEISDTGFSDLEEDEKREYLDLERLLSELKGNALGRVGRYSRPAASSGYLPRQKF